jgi:hypothetical protein
MKKKFYLQQHYPQMKPLDTTTYLTRKLIVVLSIRPPCSIVTSTNFHLPNKIVVQTLPCVNKSEHQCIESKPLFMRIILKDWNLWFTLKFKVISSSISRNGGITYVKLHCMATHSNVLHEEIRLLSSIFFFPLKN